MKSRMTGCLWLGAAFAALGLAMLFEPHAQAARAYVPQWTSCVNPGGTGGCYSSIQAAIDASSYGAAINVWGGTYDEHITMKNGVSVYGQGWDFSQTVINGRFSANQSTVYFPSGIDATTVLSGVQVTGGGTGDPSTSYSGSGIYMFGASPKIVNTWLYSNTAMYGGGAHVSGGSPTFTNVPAWYNLANNGGGFYLENNAQPTFFGNPMELANGTVLWNTANSGGGFSMREVTATLAGLRVYWNTSYTGAGVEIFSATHTITLFLNDISGNAATRCSGGCVGGGIYADSAANLEISTNLIANNTAGGVGGGVYLNQSGGQFQDNVLINNKPVGMQIAGSATALKVEGNWFESNSAVNGGGGLYVGQGAAPLVNANVFVTNTAPTGSAIFLMQAGPVTVTNNILARNTGVGCAINVQQTAARIVNNTIADTTGCGVGFNQAEGIILANNIMHHSSSGWGIFGTNTALHTEDYNDLVGDANSLPAGSHDLSVDPQFVGAGDLRAYYHIKATSPISKTGSLAWAPAKDIDGDPRTGFTSMGADQIPIQARGLYLPLVMR